MAKSDNFLGVSYVGLGAPGDGVMGATLVEFPDVEVGSITFEGSTPNETTIPTEADDAYITLNDTATATTVKLRFYGVTPAQKVLLAGGTENGDFWEAPGTIPNIFLSLQMKGNAIDGRRGVLEIPYGKILARDQGNITKNGLPAFDVTVTANTPVAANGDKGAPYRRGHEAA